MNFVRNDMDENEDERLSNITLEIQIKLKKQHFYIAVLHYTVTAGSSTISITHINLNFKH